MDATSNLCHSNEKRANGKSRVFELIELPYKEDALEPVISRETINYHYGKHLSAYIANLNALLNGLAENCLSLEYLVRQSEGALFNNAGQVLNHNLYFLQFSPTGGGEPMGLLASAIEKEWGTIDNFKSEFVLKGTSLFGAGWVWLVKDSAGTLSIKQYANAGNPVMDSLIPLLCFDVWEHAYYLDYQNRRADHLNKLWKIIDWNIISERFEKTDCSN